MITDRIIFIIDEDRELLFDGSSFQKISSKKTKDYFSAATLPSSLIHTYGFKLPKNTSAEKLEIQAEMRMYDEAGLDPDIEFQVSSLVIPLENDDDNYIESYATEISKLDEKFSSIVKKYKQIDTIFPPALSYISLYSFELLEKKSDIFIHFGEDDSYVVIFKDGHYISTRSIISLNELSQKIGLELAQLKELLTTKGLDKDLYSPDEFLQMGNIEDELLKIIERVSHTVSHKRGVFKLETIDRIYLDFEGCDIPNFLDSFDNYGYESATKELLDVFENVEKGMKNFALNALYALGGVQDRYRVLNQSIYERKPPFIKTNVGQFSTIMLLSMSLACAYPIYAYMELEKLNEEQNRLETDIKKIEKITKKLYKNLKQERVKRDELKKDKLYAISKIDSYDKIVNSLERFNQKTLIRQKMMKDVNIAMKKYALSSKYLKFRNSNSISVHIVTKYNNRYNIARFIKELISDGYSNVYTKKVEKTENYYESFVEIHL